MSSYIAFGFLTILKNKKSNIYLNLVNLNKKLHTKNLISQAYQTYTQISLDSIFLQFEVKVQNIVFILRS